MFDLLLNRFSLGLLYFTALARGFLRYRNPLRRAADKHRVAFYDRAWREAAEQLGARWRMLGGGIAEIRHNGQCTLVTENMCEIDGPVTLAMLSDKLLTYQILKEEGIRVPAHTAFSLKNMKPAVEFVRAEDRECVVKPVRGTGGGRGITTGIRRKRHLAFAAAAAGIYCDDLLIEEQVAGLNYRLLYLDGKLIDAFVRQPPTVIGDGTSSIRRLVRRANDERLREGSGVSQVLLTIDPDMRRTLARQGLKLGSVPAAGTRVVLKTVVNENRGVDNSTATSMLCSSIVEDGAKAARALGVRLAGVDIITPDPAVPLAESGGVIIEVNAPPNYYFHYHKSDGSYPVAVDVLRKLLGGPVEIGEELAGDERHRLAADATAEREHRLATDATERISQA